ncbi:hypothetical protein LTR08_009305 [Meristemomyces frigidus]|nr:hypothetical protein LTR08_009305 [Meristemomyces frigidus]
MGDRQPTDMAVGEQQQSWDASQYEAALARLESLQEQLDGLRASIPSLAAPLLRPHVSRAQMFAEIKKSALQTTDDLRSFREDWMSEQTQQLLVRSRTSLEEDGDLKKGDSVARYGWAPS